MTAFEISLRHLMTAASVPGLALALVDQGQVQVISMGVAEFGSPRPITERTVFDAASLSKPLASCIALQLVDEGLLDLDAPLAGMITTSLPECLATSSISARHVLTHTCGLRNLRGSEPLQVYFAPGSWFSYSSVGFSYLQMAMEALTNESLESLAKRLVFDPLGMQSSSFEWQERFGHDVAVPHEGEQRLDKHHPPSAQASYSLQTTAADYGRFMAAVLDGALLKETTQRQWLTPAAMVPRRDAVHLEATAPETEKDLGWGLGWGLEITRGTFFQWGKMDGIRALAMGHAATRRGIVLLTHSNHGLRLMDIAASTALPGPHPAFAWLRACVTE